MTRYECLIDSTNVSLDSKNSGSKGQSYNMRLSLSETSKNINELILTNGTVVGLFESREEMYKAADEKGCQFYLAKDVGSTGAKYYLAVESASIYVKILPLISEKDRMFYEIFREGTSCKPSFDLEWYGYLPGTNHEPDPEVIYCAFVEHINKVFVKLWGTELDPQHICVLENHRSNPLKYSYHLIINGYRLVNHHQYMKYFAEKIIESINDEPDSILHLCAGKSGQPQLPIDLSIYGKNKCLRLKDHHKYGDCDRVLKIPSVMEEEDELNYLATENITKCALLKLDLPQISEKNHSVTNFGSKNFGIIGEYLNIIDVTQIKYDDWIKIGIALYNTFGLIKGMEYYDSFSRRFDCYDQKELEKTWNSFQRGNYTKVTTGTILYYTRATNPEGYISFALRNTNRKMSEHYLRLAMSNTHGDVGRLVNEFVHNRVLHTDGLSSTSRLWFIFKDHYWVEGKGVAKINEIIEEEVLLYVQEKKSELKKQTSEMEKGEKSEEMNKVLCDIENLDKLVSNLNNDNFISHVINRINHKLYQPEAFHKFDETEHILGCTNGVLDLKKLEFRDGAQEDFVLTTTGIDFLTGDEHGSYSDEHPHIKGIHKFFAELQPNPKVRRYLQLLLGSCLSGRNVKEQLYMFTGVGSNGKTKLFELIGYALGKYSGSISMNYFTGKKGASNQATPEVAHIAKARIVSSSEIDKGEKINLDIFKNITGNDKITYRCLNQPIRETVPKFTLLFAVNHLPELPPEDGALWRRVRVIKFDSCFVDNPDPNLSNEFKKDIYIYQKLKEYRHAMLWLLFKWYGDFVKEGLDDIPEVMEATRDYQSDLDIVKPWLDENLKVTGNPNDFVRVKDLKEKLIDEGLYREMFKKDKEFVDYLKVVYPKCQYQKNLKRAKDLNGNDIRIYNSFLGISYQNISQRTVSYIG